MIAFFSTTLYKYNYSGHNNHELIYFPSNNQTAQVHLGLKGSCHTRVTPVNEYTDIYATLNLVKLQLTCSVAPWLPKWSQQNHKYLGYHLMHFNWVRWQNVYSSSELFSPLTVNHSLVLETVALYTPFWCHIQQQQQQYFVLFFRVVFSNLIVWSPWFTQEGAVLKDIFPTRISKMSVLNNKDRWVWVFPLSHQASTLRTKICQLGSLCVAAGNSYEAGLWFVCCQSNFCFSPNSQIQKNLTRLW